MEGEFHALPEQTPEDNLISVLCDFYWYATHPEEKEDGTWHRDEQSEAFAERVMNFIKQELERGAK